MKDVKEQLKTLSKNLLSLSKQVDKLSKQVEKPKAAKKAAPKKKVAAKKTAAKAPKAVKAPKAAKTAKAPKAPKAPKAAAGDTVLAKVHEVIKKAKKGATIATLKTKTGLNARQLSNALYKLSKKGAIKAVSRGVYTKA